MQNLGLVGMMTVEWPPSLQGLFAVCQFLLLDIDSYGFSCVAGNWAAVGLFRPERICSVPPERSHFPYWHRMDGAVLRRVAMCYKHPNGLRSLLKYPGVICGSAEHSAMLVIGSIFLAIFVVGFVVICGYAVYKVPSWSIRRLDNRVGAVRFLVFRFR
eukprot:Skav202221  [mRNA]  locus=scaffold2694:30565:31975:+ [translate_table: standard]